MILPSLPLCQDWDEDVPVYTLQHSMEQAQEMLKTVTGECSVPLLQVVVVVVAEELLSICQV